MKEDLCQNFTARDSPTVNFSAYLDAAIPDPKPADIDNRDFYLEKTKLGGYTISKKPRFTEKEPLDIEMIRHIKKFPAMPDQVNPNNKD